MKTPNKHRIPAILSLFAFIAAFAVIVIVGFFFNRVLINFNVPKQAYIFVPLIAAANTFIFSSIGIYVLTEKAYSPIMPALCGFILGILAFLCVALPTILLTVEPSIYQHILGTIIAIAFLAGGFLAPLIGAIMGYYLAKRRD